MNNNKSLLSKIVKYVLMLLFVVGGVFGIYSYMNKNSIEPQVRVEQKVESTQSKEEPKKNDEYVVDQAEKDYLANKFKDLKATNYVKIFRTLKNKYILSKNKPLTTCKISKSK